MSTEAQEAATLRVVAAAVDALADGCEKEAPGTKLARWADLTVDQQRQLAAALHPLLAPTAAFLQLA